MFTKATNPSVEIVYIIKIFNKPGKLWVLLDDFIERSQDSRNGVVHVPLRVPTGQLLHQISHCVKGQDECQMGFRNYEEDWADCILDNHALTSANMIFGDFLTHFTK